MTKTFENGPHAAVTPAPTMPAPAAATAATTTNTTNVSASQSTPPPAAVSSKAVYNAIVSATTSNATASIAATNATANSINTAVENNTTSLSEEDSVTNLDELKLRSLLEEAIAYKSPKDREGKSKLFKTLLIDAEDDLRKEHAHNASGPARHYSSTAKKRHRQRHRQPSSVSVNLTHGGSLNDLAKQELYAEAYDTSSSPTCGGGGGGGGGSPLQLLRGCGGGGAKTVSTRQREGGSLPCCNVSAGAPRVDAAYFMEERARQLAQRSKQRDKEAAATAATTVANALRLGDFQQEAACVSVATVATATTTNFISNKSITVAGNGSGGISVGGCATVGNNVDDAMSFAQLSGVTSLGTHNPDGTPRTSLVKQIPMQHFSLVAQKDENDNSVAPTSSLAVNSTSSTNHHTTTSAASAASGTKRKSKQRKPTEKSTPAENIEGHRADIIENIDKLVSYIEGTEEKAAKVAKKQVHKQHSHTLTKEDDRSKSKRARKKSSSMMLHKSNSMEEMSTTKLEDFHFEPLDVKEKAPLRTTKSNAERPSRHHKAWVLSSEQLPVSTSAENLADFIYVTKKKKSKKRRNSLGSRAAPPTSESRPAEFHSLRACSRNSPIRKSASSAPHSEKSADSSDNESVHSLPLDDGDAKSQHISYADIAKCSERPKWNRPTADRRKNIDKPSLTLEEKKVEVVEVMPEIVSIVSPVIMQETVKSQQDAPAKAKETDTDLSSMQNWPEIRNNKVNQAKNVVETLQDWPSIISNGAKSNNVVKPTADVQPHAKSDNKSKKTMKPCNQAANEHLQQVLQVSNANTSYIYRQNHNNQEHHEEEIIINNPQQVIQQVSEQQHLYQMPPNIRDVQSIEEMQIRSLQAAQMSPAIPATVTTSTGVVEEVDENDEYASYVMPPPQATTPTMPPHAIIGSSAPVSQPEKHRPAVVILSSSSGDRHSTADITFGFGINEQLLAGDACADFVSRFLPPDVSAQHVTTHLDQLVNYVGSQWEEIIMQTHTGKVKYYTDELS